MNGEIGFIFNTFSFLLWGGLVMWMAAGFTMLEAGSVRTKNASVICLKNIGLYAIAGIAYYVIGYNLMYVDVQGWIGSFLFLYGPSADEIALLEGNAEAQASVIENGYSVMSGWFFQMVFVAEPQPPLSPVRWPSESSCGHSSSSCCCLRRLSTRSSEPGLGAAVG